MRLQVKRTVRNSHACLQISLSDDANSGLLVCILSRPMQVIRSDTGAGRIQKMYQVPNYTFLKPQLRLVKAS